MKSKRTSTCISILSDQLDRLRAYSKRTYIPMSSVIKMALDEFFEKNDKKEPKKAES